MTTGRRYCRLRSARSDAAAAGEEDDRGQDSGGGGAGAGGVVAITGIETGELEFVVDEVIQGRLEGAGKEFTRQIDGEEARAGVDDFAAGHGRFPVVALNVLNIPDD